MKAQLKLPPGFAIKNCTTWNARFNRSEDGRGPRWLGKPQAPGTSINIWFEKRWPKGIVEGPIIQLQGQPSFEENAAMADGGPNQIPDVPGLKKAMQGPMARDDLENFDIFKYYYYTDDEDVFCEGFVGQSLLCGLRGEQYFMTWLYSGREIEANLREMLEFRKVNTK